MKRRAFAELIKRIVRRSKLESILLASTVIFGIIGIIVVPNILGKSIWTSLMGLIGGACIGLLGFLFGGLAVWKFYDDIM